jgi:hypothetical protein
LREAVVPASKISRQGNWFKCLIYGIKARHYSRGP